jgi:hypothetical protein
MKKLLLSAALLAMTGGEAAASCGSAFCMVNTNWNVEGAWIEPGARVDLRFEYIDQDQPRAGSRKVGVGELPQDHDEIRTVNRNWIGTYGYTFNQDWGVSATLPYSIRDHSHIHHDIGGDVMETWHFGELGDARVLGRRQWHAESAEAQRLDFFGATFGLKLPTGRTDVRNDDGELAERTLQPGSGTTDALLGGYFRRVLGSGTSWFADLLWQRPLNSHEEFRPGDRLSVDIGVRREMSERLGLMLQLNYLHRARDSGDQAEPDDSGGKFLFVSPSVSYALGKNLQLYSFVQLPLYQYVNGVQLTADWSFVAGASVRF